LHGVEQLGGNQDRKQNCGADPVRLQQPAEVPDRRWDSQEHQQAAAPAHAPPLRDRLPRHTAKPDIPWTAAHWNSQTRVCGVLKRCSSDRKKVSCPTVLFVWLKNRLLSWKDASTKS